jgi:bis(5'-nucleosyl)-tetraphosphatase (symmetrical)
MKTLVVGDIQGCADELEDLLTEVRFQTGEDRLVCCGDLVNRGPKSLATLRLVRSIGGELVLGNHDLHLLAVAAGLRSGSRDTFGDIINAPDLPDLLNWLVDRPTPAIWVEDFVAVHAGIPPSFVFPDDAQAVNIAVRSAWASKAPFSQRVREILKLPMLRFLTYVRYCNAKGERPSHDDAIDPPGFQPWFDFQEHSPRIAFGHWARLDPARAERDNLRFLDTGCVYGGRLTGWLVEEDRLISVPARAAYWRLGG